MDITCLKHMSQDCLGCTAELSRLKEELHRSNVVAVGAEARNEHLELTIKELQVEKALLRERNEKLEAVAKAAKWLEGCPYHLDSASIPKSGDMSSSQIVGVMSLRKDKYSEFMKALAALDGNGEGR